MVNLILEKDSENTFYLIPKKLKPKFDEYLALENSDETDSIKWFDKIAEYTKSFKPFMLSSLKDLSKFNVWVEEKNIKNLQENVVI